MVSTSSPGQAARESDFEEVAAPVELVDFCAEGDVTDGAVETAAEESAAEQPGALKRVYFVRVPRPPMDEAGGQGQLKRLQDDFQAHVAKIKKLNGKLAIKRDEVRELRRQMSQARSLKGESQPEFEEKLTRLKQLKDLRVGYQTKISDIRTVLKGLECKSEEELDAKIKDMEHRISHSQLELREEKQFVKMIGVLGSQREKIKEYDAQKGSLSEMEGEVTKIKAVIAEMDGEFSILKGERDSAQKIIGDFYAKLQVAEKALKEVEEEQADAVRAKNESLEALDSARDAQNADMKDYRANRKFSMQVRDMVAAGQVEEAALLCQAQVEEWTARLGTDVTFRDSYTKLWAGQRKYAVSELLPHSSTEVMEALAAAAKGSKGAKGKAGADGDKPRAVANGAEKARLLIASLMQEASKEAQEKQQERVRQRAAEPRHEEDENDADDEDNEPVILTPGEIVTAAVEAAAKKAQLSRKEPANLVMNANAKATEVFGAKIELPVVAAGTPEFVLPVTSTSNGAEQASKEQIREEQRLKAKEAEDRKKRRQEQADEKRVKGAERQKVQEAEAKVAEAKAAAQKVAALNATAAAAASKAAAVAKAAEEAEADAPDMASKPSASNTFRKTTVVASAKRPASKGFDSKLKKLWQQHQTSIVVAAVVLFLIIILMLVSIM